jgi:hypothetical protein
MMDESGVVPTGSHFCRPWTRNGMKKISWHDRCTVAPIRYYYIDFGLSTRQKDAIALGIFGQVKTVPEQSETIPYDPYKADVYQLGYTFLEIIEVRATSKQVNTQS